MLKQSTNEVLLDLLKDSFNYSELRTLVFILFPSEYNNLEGMSLNEARMETISFAMRQGQIPQLIDYVKTNNEYQYRRHLPAIGRNLSGQYKEIRAINEFDDEPSDTGPNIDWMGPEDEIQLQFSLKPEPDFLDVGFLIKAIARASSVCRVEVPTIGSQGTGFLIAPDRVLTNYHVIAPLRDHDINVNAADVTLHFFDVSRTDNQDIDRLITPLASNAPIIKSSPIHELDFALLKLEAGKTQQIDSIPYSLSIPARGESMNILQHPDRQPLKLAVSGNGVDKVIQERGLVQYSTRALGGSSGAPCFNDNWEVVALHHAQRARSLYSIREGIIFKSIYDEIRQEI